MTDAERESHIKSCCLIMEQSVEQYRMTHHLSYLWEATELLRMMDESINWRSNEQVNGIEEVRGLR